MSKRFIRPVAGIASAVLIVSVCHQTLQVSLASTRAPASADEAEDITQHQEMPPTMREFDNIQPNAGVQLTTSPSAFGGGAISSSVRGASSWGILLEVEYQPSFLQRYGVIGIGPSVGLYPIGTIDDTDQRATSSWYSVFSYGGQLRYQLRLWDRQLVVPSGSLEIDELHYSFINASSGQVTIAGGSLGLELFLNRLAPRTALNFFDDFGIARSYLIAQAKSLTGSDSNVGVAGTSFYFGLRLEF